MKASPVFSLVALTLLAFAVFPESAAAQGGGLRPPPVPPGNPITRSKILLGKTLFWDEQLSSPRNVSCGSCHMPEAGGSDPRTFPGDRRTTHPGPDGSFGTPDDVAGSPGVIRSLANGDYVADPVYSLAPQVTPRRSMPVIMAAYSPRTFWDGRGEDVFRDPLTGQVLLNRFAALESQVLGPLLGDVEMAHQDRDWNEVTARIASSRPLALAGGITPDLAAWLNGRGYPDLFREAFGSPGITPARIAMAIATYERTLIPDQAPIFAFLAGDTAALTPQEQRGFNLFNSPRLSCSLCHFGAQFSDQRFKYTGVRPQNEDLGLGGVSGLPTDNGKMKTPSLLDVELRPPYFHGGQAATLEEVVDFYDRGGDFDGPNKAPTIAPIGLTPQQRADLLAFLRRPLTDPRVRDGLPPFDHPITLAESGRAPGIYGRPTPGSAGIPPVMVAVEPPDLGNPSMTVGIDHALGGADAALVVDRAADPLGHMVQGARSFLAMGTSQRVTIVSLDGSGPGQGTGSVSFTIPADPALLGLHRYAQWFVADPGTPGGLAATPAAEFVLF